MPFQPFQSQWSFFVLEADGGSLEIYVGVQELPLCIARKGISLDKQAVLVELPQCIDLAGDSGVIGRMDGGIEGQTCMHLAGRRQI